MPSATALTTGAPGPTLFLLRTNRTQDRRGDGPCFHLHVRALTAQRDRFTRVSFDAHRPENVIGVAMARIYALHGVRVTREQVLVERMVPSDGAT